MHLHLALVIVGDDEIRHRQTEARALADFLGGEKRLEGALAHAFRHADAVVLDLNFRPGRVKARAQNNAPRLTGILTLMDGLSGVLQQIEQHLLQLVGRRRHRAQIRIELANDVLALEVKTDGQVKVVAGDLHRLINQCRQITGRQLTVAAAAEAEHVADDLSRPRSG